MFIVTKLYQWKINVAQGGGAGERLDIPSPHKETGKTVTTIPVPQAELLCPILKDSLGSGLCTSLNSGDFLL